MSLVVFCIWRQNISYSPAVGSDDAAAANVGFVGGCNEVDDEDDDDAAAPGVIVEIDAGCMTVAVVVCRDVVGASDVLTDCMCLVKAPTMAAIRSKALIFM